MVAGYINDPGSVPHFMQDLLHDGIVALVPEPGALDAPSVDDITHQIDSLSLIVPQKIQQQICFAAGGAQVNIG